jgi:beta-N-acetylhexosaminidase
VPSALNRSYPLWTVPKSPYAAGCDSANFAPARRHGGREEASLSSTTRSHGRPSSRSIAARLTWGTLRGHRPNDDERELLREGLGGVVLFTRSLGDLADVRELIADLRRTARPNLHVSVDQEGGHIVRLRDGFTAFPSAMAIGATRSAGLAFAAARASGRELASAGFDTVLAPVVDLAADLRNPTLGARSFGSDPRLVARLGAAAVSGYLAAGVLPVAKHFPGHGRTPVDSHISLPVVAGGMGQLRRDLRPFAAAVRAGAPMLMSAHVTYRALADGEPATLSRLVTRLAREELHFDGVLLTDAMVMNAISSFRAVPDASVAALVAGSDIVMVLEPARAAIDAMASAIDDGIVPPDRIADALRRTVALDAEDTTLVTSPPEISADEFAAHEALATEIARRSLTLAWDDALLPLSTSTPLLFVDLASVAASPVEDAPRATQHSAVASAIASRFTRANVLAPDARDEAAVDAAIAAAMDAEVVIVATRDAFMSAPNRRLVDRLGDAGKRVIRIALHSPADLMLSPRPHTAIAAYTEVPSTARALADALVTGSSAFPGRLPVTLDPRAFGADATDGAHARETLAPVPSPALAG